MARSSIRWLVFLSSLTPAALADEASKKEPLSTPAASATTATQKTSRASPPPDPPTNDPVRPPPLPDLQSGQADACPPGSYCLPPPDLREPPPPPPAHWSRRHPSPPGDGYPEYLGPPAPPPRPYREWGIHLRLEGVDVSSDRSSRAGMGGAGFAFRARPSPFFACDFGLDGFSGRDYYGRNRSEGVFTLHPMFFVNPQNPVQVYLLTGVSFSNATVETSPSHRDTYHYVGIDGGIGLEWRVTPRTAISLDWVGFVRGRTNPVRNHPEFVDPATGRSTDTSAGGVARLGLAIYWQ